MKLSPLLVAVLSLNTIAPAQAQETWPLWGHYADHFLDPSGRVVDHDRNEMTTSEGQAYGLFFALVANDPVRFEKLYNWTERNLAGGSFQKHLAAWSWGRSPHDKWGVLDRNSASDADLWIACTLLEAGRLWDQPKYTKSGMDQLALMERSEVAVLPSVGPVLLPAAHGFQTSENTATLNPSYLPLFLLARAQGAHPDGPWDGIASAFPGWLKLATPHAFAMDWVSFAEPDGFKSVPSPGSSGVAAGSYDAIRVYLWAGLTDKKTAGRNEILEALSGMGSYMSTHDGPPEIVGPDGRVVSTNAPVGFSAALIPYLDAAGLAESAVQQKLVEAQWNPQTGLYGPDTHYYDQNLAMFALGWAEHRYQFSADGQLKLKWER